MIRKIVIGLVITSLFSCSLQDKQNPQTCGDESIICGVSLINLIVEPRNYDNKIISVEGYFHITPRGPFYGYWLSTDKEHLDFASAIKVKIPKGAPQLNWVQDGGYYRASGIFKNCLSINCRPEIIEYEKMPGIVVPAS